ncbi:hypothetical protein MPTK1_2g16670 [Marchantia polymorpha subsp. ruderalis]|uniref:Uncharacterized protein n=1 Tax=Marchantia polymorpha TaxID=3197 RepID=A0A2R6WCK5_MARPO|nr:hypothetical protein MARPO_0109s0008 [Marchantia polymorpha]BBN02615.1 hypothetical protein Mp_2g16670 [Marchantia polymorpha subsp. ruderalis]|eukprot:PTQ31573.1 hypothetical protein MARPO_0109s0008 [Marchantia polymorpha]
MHSDIIKRSVPQSHINPKRGPTPRSATIFGALYLYAKMMPCISASWSTLAIVVCPLTYSYICIRSEPNLCDTDKFLSPLVNSRCLRSSRAPRLDLMSSQHRPEQKIQFC